MFGHCCSNVEFWSSALKTVTSAVCPLEPEGGVTVIGQSPDVPLCHALTGFKAGRLSKYTVLSGPKPVPVTVTVPSVLLETEST